MVAGSRAMRRRDREALGAYRHALAAIDNAEAVVPDGGIPRAGAVEEAATGLGAAATATDAPELKVMAAVMLAGMVPPLALAARAADLAPLTQLGSKLGFDTHGGDHAEVARYEAAFARAWSSDDLSEGRSAFRERRTPQFQGR